MNVGDCIGCSRDLAKHKLLFVMLEIILKRKNYDFLSKARNSFERAVEK